MVGCVERPLGPAAGVVPSGLVAGGEPPPQRRGVATAKTRIGQDGALACSHTHGVGVTAHAREHDRVRGTRCREARKRRKFVSESWRRKEMTKLSLSLSRAARETRANRTHTHGHGRPGPSVRPGRRPRRCRRGVGRCVHRLPTLRHLRRRARCGRAPHAAPQLRDGGGVPEVGEEGCGGGGWNARGARESRCADPPRARRARCGRPAPLARCPRPARRPCAHHPHPHPHLWTRIRRRGFVRHHTRQPPTPLFTVSSILLPRITYPIFGTLRAAAQTGALSDLQLEAVALACQRHGVRLPAPPGAPPGAVGPRAGLLCGDATGTGEKRGGCGDCFVCVSLRPREGGGRGVEGWCACVF